MKQNVIVGATCSFPLTLFERRTYKFSSLYYDSVEVSPILPPMAIFPFLTATNPVLIFGMFILIGCVG